MTRRDVSPRTALFSVPPEERRRPGATSTLVDRAVALSGKGEAGPAEAHVTALRLRDPGGSTARDRLNGRGRRQRDRALAHVERSGRWSSSNADQAVLGGVQGGGHAA